MTTSTHDWKSYVSRTDFGNRVRADFAVEGVHCASCMSKIENGVGEDRRCSKCETKPVNTSTSGRVESI